MRDETKGEALEAHGRPRVGLALFRAAPRSGRLSPIEDLTTLLTAQSFAETMACEGHRYVIADFRVPSIPPQKVINKWVMSIPEIVRRIIKHEGNNNFHG
jgi:hypothetical protein